MPSVLPAPLLTIPPAVQRGPRAGTATIAIARFTFAPEVLVIPAGATVTWVNHDDSPHTATADDGAFDTGSLRRGERASVTSETPGIHRYACAWNPGITATIVVTPLS